MASWTRTLVAGCLTLVTALAFAKVAPRPQPGEAAPAFALPSTNGKTIKLSDFKGRRVVLAFFVRAFTGGWTRELSAYRELAARFADANAQVLGVSNDDVTTLTKFAKSLKLPFPLLSDASGAVARAYGTAVEENGKVDYEDRVTFVIDGKGRVQKVFDGDEALDPAPALSACTAR